MIIKKQPQTQKFPKSISIHISSTIPSYTHFQMTRFLSLLTLSLLLAMVQVQAKLQVSNLAQLGPLAQDPDLKDIAYSIANFGFVPFGKTMVGYLQETPGLDDQCKVGNASLISRSLENSFLMIPRGGCPFVTKALHAQQLGAKLAIIFDNEDHDRKVIMKDNGYGYKVTIPSIFINHKLGQKLKTLFEKSKTQIFMKISFDSQKSQKVDVVLYMQSLNRLSYYFIQEFKPIYNSIKNRINFHIAYDVLNCSICSPDDCYHDGLFCSVTYEHGQSATGQMVLNQQLRQQIMFQRHEDQWWIYIQCISLECSKISQVTQCSNKCLSQTTVKPTDLQSELQKSFDFKKDNAILRKNLETLKNAGIQTYPSVTLNNIKVKGSLNAEFIFDDICNSLLKPPPECSAYVVIEQETIVNVTQNYWITIILVLVLCGALFVGLFIFCRRVMKKRMAQEMQGRVDDMVSKYIQFYSERDKK